MTWRVLYAGSFSCLTCTIRVSVIIVLSSKLQHTLSNLDSFQVTSSSASDSKTSAATVKIERLLGSFATCQAYFS